jgi:hypothetical protein
MGLDRPMVKGRRKKNRTNRLLSKANVLKEQAWHAPSQNGFVSRVGLCSKNYFKSPGIGRPK